MVKSLVSKGSRVFVKEGDLIYLLSAFGENKILDLKETSRMIPDSLELILERPPSQLDSGRKLVQWMNDQCR